MGAVPAHRRLLPAALGAMGVLLAVKVAVLVAAPPGAGDAADASSLVSSAKASEAAPPPTAKAAPTHPPAAPGPAAVQCGPEGHAAVTPEQRAERDLLQALRARRTELDAREQALLTREVLAEAMERRTAQRLEEFSAAQRKVAAEAAGAAVQERAELERQERERQEREAAGWRQMVKLYEGMRPRDAAAIFDDLDLAVLVPLMDRLREAKAAPILGAMRPDRARALTAELARHRSGARDR